MIPTRGEHRSGPFLSDALSVVVPAKAPEPPRPQKLSLRLRLTLWLLVCGIGPASLGFLAFVYVGRQAESRAAFDFSRILQELWVVQASPERGSCDALAPLLWPRLKQVSETTGQEVALYIGEAQKIGSDLGRTGVLPLRLPSEVYLRALESPRPIRYPLMAHGQRYLGYVFRLEAGSLLGCNRALLLTATKSRPVFGSGPIPWIWLAALVVLGVLPGILVPTFLVGPLLHLRERVATPLPQEDPLLKRRDEVGDVARAFFQLSSAMKEQDLRLGERVRELTTLHAIGRAISSVLDLEESLRKIVSEVVGVFSARRCALVLIGPDMRHTLGAGHRIDPSAADAVAALGEAIIRRGGALRVEDLSQDSELYASARHGGLSGSLMAAPLDQQGRILGVLLITRRGRHPFSESDLQLLSTVADQAATAISNARLYAEVQRSSEELELRVKERTFDLVMTNQELARAVEDLRQTQAQLVLSERLAGLGQLVAGVAHEINSPAGAIKGAADALPENVARMAERTQHLEELRLPPEVRARFLRTCDELAPRLGSALLFTPAHARRESRLVLGHLAVLLPALSPGPGPDPNPDDPSANTPQKQLQSLIDLCRKLVNLGVSATEESDLQLLDTLALAAAAETSFGSARAPDSSIIITRLAVLVGYLEQRAYLHRNAHAIRTAIGQITRIVGALKRYSHLDQVRVELTDIHEGLETTLIILHSELKYGIVLTRKYRKVPAIPAYVDELNQVWTNLLHNAVQALQQRQDPTTPKEIIIETGCSTRKATEIPLGAEPTLTKTAEGMLLVCSAEQEEGGEVWVAIEDNGPGIDPEILPRIFEPFFTTKPKGEGTGMGLGIVKQIVNKHRGRIEVLSTSGRTRFTVFLPDSSASTASPESPPREGAS